MAGHNLPSVILSEGEQAELVRLSTRRKTAQAIALRHGSYLRQARVRGTKKSPRALASIRHRSANGAAAFSQHAWMGFTMSRVQARRVELPTIASRR